MIPIIVVQKKKFEAISLPPKKPVSKEPKEPAPPPVPITPPEKHSFADEDDDKYKTLASINVTFEQKKKSSRGKK